MFFCKETDKYSQLTSLASFGVLLFYLKAGTTMVANKTVNMKIRIGGKVFHTHTHTHTHTNSLSLSLSLYIYIYIYIYICTSV